MPLEPVTQKKGSHVYPLQRPPIKHAERRTVNVQTLFADCEIAPAEELAELLGVPVSTIVRALTLAALRSKVIQVDLAAEDLLIHPEDLGGS